MSVKVNYKGAEIFSADTDTTKTLQTAGKYCEDDIEIVNTQDGGGFLHESGEIVYHTGANVYELTVPVSDDTKTHYVVFVKTKNTWAKVDGVWIEREGLDFTGLSGQMCFACMVAYPKPESNSAINSSGAAVDGIFLPTPKVAFSSGNSAMSAGNAGYTISVANGAIKFEIEGYDRFAAQTTGTTIEYTVIGWD